MSEQIRMPSVEEAYINAISAAKDRSSDADEYRVKLNEIKERYENERVPALQELAHNMDIEALIKEYENSILEKAA